VCIQWVIVHTCQQIEGDKIRRVHKLRKAWVQTKSVFVTNIAAAILHFEIRQVAIAWISKDQRENTVCLHLWKETNIGLPF